MYLSVKSKSMIQCRRSPVRMAESTNVNVTKSDVKKNVRERSQPQKIYELMGEEYLKSAQKRELSEKKQRALPERLGRYWTDVKEKTQVSVKERAQPKKVSELLAAENFRSAQKCKSYEKHKRVIHEGMRRFYTDVKQKRPDETAGPREERKVKRNLNFNNISVHKSERNMTEDETDMEENHRKKEITHNKNKEERATKTEQIRLNANKEAACRMSKIPQIPRPLKSRRTIITNKSINTNNNNGNNMVLRSAQKTRKPRPSMKPEDSTPLLKKQVNFKVSEIRKDVRSAKKSGGSTPRRHLLRSYSLIDLKLNEGVTEPHIEEFSLVPPISKFKSKQINKLKPCNESPNASDVICINREEFMELKKSLEHLVRRTEEDLNELKSGLSCMTKILARTFTPKIQRNIEKSAEKKARPCSEEKVAEEKQNKETQVDITEMTAVKSPALTVITPSIVTSIDKENNEPSEFKDSFTQMENEFNITCTKDPPMKQEIKKVTPSSVMTRHMRSLREYISLKNSISFLETPNAKKCRSLCDGDLTSLSAQQRQISTKLLADLQDLYADSP